MEVKHRSSLANVLKKSLYNALCAGVLICFLRHMEGLPSALQSARMVTVIEYLFVGAQLYVTEDLLSGHDKLSSQ